MSPPLASLLRMSAELFPEPDRETTVRPGWPQKPDPVAFDLSVMRHNVREIRRTLDNHTLHLDDLAESLGLHGGQLAALAEGQRQQGVVLNEHGAQLAALGKGTFHLRGLWNVAMTAPTPPPRAACVCVNVIGLRA